MLQMWKVKFVREVDGERDSTTETCMYLYLSCGCRHVDIRVLVSQCQEHG